MSKPLPPTPEPKPAFLRFTAKDIALVLSSPAVVLVALALAAAPGVVGVLFPHQPPTVTPVPVLSSAPGTPAGPFFSGALPAPGPNQKRAGTCDPEREQVEINGGCWMETKRPPPCPRGKLWEHEGKCWIPVGEAKPVPTSGDVQRAAVADP